MVLPCVTISYYDLMFNFFFFRISSCIFTCSLKIILIYLCNVLHLYLHINFINFFKAYFYFEPFNISFCYLKEIYMLFNFVQLCFIHYKKEKEKSMGLLENTNKCIVIY